MLKPTGIELVQLFNTATPIEFSNAMDNFINCYSVDVDGFIDALSKESETLKVRFSTISLLWVKKMNYFKEIKWFDLRNEESIVKCYSIKLLLSNKLDNFFPGYDGHLEEINHPQNNPMSKAYLSYEVQFVEELSKTHKTLQQVFTGIVLNWLMFMGYIISDEFFKEVSSQLNDTFDEHFPSLPFI